MLVACHSLHTLRCSVSVGVSVWPSRPDPGPAGLPAASQPPCRQAASASASDAPSPHLPPAQRHRHRHRRHRPPPPPPPTPPRRRRLNFGERLGIAFAGVAVAMQVVLGAFLALRAWQLRRLDKAEVSSSTPLT
uniref:Uncharacterized protein n=1 Tax=Saccharum hybrid cultivar R570 TaxID=131158 RepID=A0A059Q0K2_9POAL|nr:hypothetical protein SHCRBa_029_J02_F_170 [Saccharum hybrid cultivar R570]